MKLNSWLSRFQSSLSRPARRRRPFPASAIERCEDRTLLTVTTLFEAAEGELHVNSDAGDAIAVGAAAGEVTVNGVGTGVAAADVIELDIDGGPQANLIDVSGVTAADFPNLLEIDIDAFGGHDSVIGSEFDDDINGGAGNDDVDAGEGDDVVLGGAGHDTLRGSGGSDRLIGGGGHDDVDGGDGDDRIFGRGGDDVIRGGAGNDVLRGQSGSDDIDGDEGRDRLIGNNGSDSLTGGAGNDVLVGGNGDDALMETADTDFILTNRRLTGNGFDRVRAVEAASLTGGAGDNKIDASGFSGSTTLSGGAGADSITGGQSDDLIEGDDGDDTISGGAGNDDIDGGSGNDDLSGGLDDDIIRGGAGSDLLDGDDGDDDLDGEEDDDVIHGGAGDDRLNGGLGIDLLDGDDGLDDETGGFSGDLDEKLIAVLTSPGGVVLGQVEFEQSPEDGDTEVELEIELEDATPGVHDITLGGVVIGQITVSADGDAELEFSNDPDDADELGLPENLPSIVSGTSVSIGTIASGSFLTETENENGGGTGGGGEGQELELEAELTGATAARGEVEFDSEFERGVQQKKFEVEIEGAAANTTLDVTLNGVVIGQITTDAFGEGELEFHTHPDDADEQLFPVDFVDPQAGDIVAVGGVVSGTLALDD